jgi:hypothetical protein
VENNASLDIKAKGKPPKALGTLTVNKEPPPSVTEVLKNFNLNSAFQAVRIISQIYF